MRLGIILHLVMPQTGQYISAEHCYPSNRKCSKQQQFNLTCAVCTGFMTCALFAVLARQAHLLHGRKCMAEMANAAFQHGLAVSLKPAVADFHGFFVALQTLLAHRKEAGLSADLDELLKRLESLVASKHAGCCPGLLQALNTESYAAACSNGFSHRLVALFHHYATSARDDRRLLDLCGACRAMPHHRYSCTGHPKSWLMQGSLSVTSQTLQTDSALDHNEGAAQLLQCSPEFVYW